MKPFFFNSRLTQVELLGLKAKNVKELLSALKKVPVLSIYHHTHRYLEQNRNLSPEHSNDFSYWVSVSLGLRKLGEKIASVDIIGFRDIEKLREAFVRIIKEYVESTEAVRSCIPGEEFHFSISRIFIIPTAYSCRTLKQFLKCMQKVTVHSLYFHMFEARMRLKKLDNDFSCWLRDGGYHGLADRISRLDPYTYTLEGLRKKIITLIKEEVLRK